MGDAGDEDGGPFFFATQKPPSAAAIDDDIYLTVTAGNPWFPHKLETVDIILSLDYARHVIAQLTGAVASAMKNEAGCTAR